MTSTEVTANPDAAARPVPTGWRGRLMPVNSVSGDRRLFALSGDTVPTRPLPIAFNGQEVLADGHDGSRVIGLITRVWLENGYVTGEGPFDLADPFAYEWARKLGDGFAGWVSIDLSDTRVEEVPLDEQGNEIPAEAFTAWEKAMLEWEADAADVAPPPEPPVVADTMLRVSQWKVMGATLVSSPAFEDVRVFPVYDEFDSTPALPALVAAAADDGSEDDTEQTGAMIALVPSDPDALVIDGGEPADQLHLTLAYLGEAVDWSPDAQAALNTALGSVLGGTVEGTVFGHARFNPDGEEPCAVYLVDSAGAREIRDAVWDVLATTPGLPALPENHGFIPHITAGYGLDVNALEYTGSVAFDRLRVAFAGQAADMVLDTEALAASAGVVYQAADFDQPEPDHYVDTWQVTADGRVSMHLGAWGECHIGFSGQCVTIPPGVSEYARFHRVPVETDAGPLRVGKITMGTGHASTDPSVTAAAAMSHYDNTGTLVAVVRCRDGEFGPWLSGRLVPWATAAQAQQMRYHEVSGDWRGRPGQLELVAALAVNVPGFMRSVAASAAEVLVAAGRVRKTPIQRIAVMPQPALTREQVRAEVRAAMAEFAVQREIDNRLAPIDARVRAARVAKLDKRAWGTK